MKVCSRLPVSGTSGKAMTCRSFPAPSSPPLRMNSWQRSHNRMPVILTVEAREAWLRDDADPRELKSAAPVSRRGDEELSGKP